MEFNRYLFSQKDEVLAELFFTALAEGIGMVKTDPVYLLRERLVQNLASVAKFDQTMIMALMIKAWNCTRSGTEVKRLGWMVGIEEFPTIQ